MSLETKLVILKGVRERLLDMEGKINGLGNVAEVETAKQNLKWLWKVCTLANVERDEKAKVLRRWRKRAKKQEEA